METLVIIPREEKGEILILGIVGFVDASNLNSFARQIYEQIEKGHSKIVLDCSKLQYINSSALGILLDARQLATRGQGDIRILNLPRKIEETFKMLGFNEYFQIFSEEKKALQSFH